LYFYNTGQKDADGNKVMLFPFLSPENAVEIMASDLASRFTGIFNAAVPHRADMTASDNARIYYGGKENSIMYTSGQTTPLSLLQELPTYEDIRQECKTASDTYSYNRQTQFEKDKNSFDLAEYIKSTTNSKPVKHGRSLFFNPCPLCGHNDDFQVTGSIYHCHSASGGTGGSIIDYLMNKHNLDVGKACDKFKYEIMGDRVHLRLYLGLTACHT